MFKSRNRNRFLLFLLVMLIVASAFSSALVAFAQDDPPAPTDEIVTTLQPTEVVVTEVATQAPVETAEPPGNPRGIDFDVLGPYIIAILIVVVLAVVAIAGTALILLYRSTPPIVQAVLVGAIDKMVELVQQYTENSAPTWDDSLGDMTAEEWKRLKQLAQQSPPQAGQGLVEYALILVLVAVVVIVILALLGPSIGNIFSNIVNTL